VAIANAMQLEAARATPALSRFNYDAMPSLTSLNLHRVSKKTSTHIIGYKLRNSCPILIIFDIKIPHII